ncbi:MAG: hypothetical protein IJF45_04005 [Clostridia bacterium]|nr:hypothetical protein [Clostridia bacterium]
MRRFCFLILLMLCLAVLIACGGNEDKSYITFGEAGVLSAQVETTQAGSIRVPSPAGTSAGFCVGWQAKTEDGTVFLRIGSIYTYEAGENKSFAPVYLNLKTEDASLVLDGTNANISFSTKVKKAEWEKFNTFIADATCGTLIFTASDIAATGGTLTHAALEKAGKTPLEIPAADMLANAGEEVYFVGALSIGSELSGSKDYTAVGYVKITYTDGSVAYVYANAKGYGPSAILLARAALLDFSDTQGGVYQYPAGDKFSPYTSEEQAKLEELSRFSVLLVFDESVKGYKRLHDDSDANLYESRLIRFGADSDAVGDEGNSAEARAIYRALGKTIYTGGGALIISVKDGTRLSEANIADILIDYGTSIGEIETYIFYNGSLVVPYKVYSDPH